MSVANLQPRDRSATSLEAVRRLADQETRRVAGRLKFYFAVLCCLGGLALATGENTDAIPVIAVFFAFFGFIFVDWLELFALPPLAAYAAMALAALYCVSDFADLEAPGNRQMVAVAQLLVFVQAILMLQRKSRRILEQLGVFCLLELIVAAVFNDAIHYGLLLVPISIVGALALCLLAVVSTWEGFSDGDGLAADGSQYSPVGERELIVVSSPDSVRSMAATANRMPRVALFALAPSVLLVAAVFFYALPRTADANRMSNRSQALVGFSETMRIEQLGRMMQSTDPAVRVYLREPVTNRPYRVDTGLYLRGVVLEVYNRTTSGIAAAGEWTAVERGGINVAQRLPRQYFPPRRSDRNFYDPVICDVTCESMKQPALFAIAPYHSERDHPDIMHSVGRWILRRRHNVDSVFPRINYSFGSHAFRRGVQTDLLGRYADPQRLLSSDSLVWERAEQAYLDQLLEYDPDAIPSASALATGVSAAISSSSRTDFRTAKALEAYLASSGLFSHTLDLTFERVPGLDPTEQFLSIDRKGHCQYFASALTMMLRSQGIPARVVVGFRTEEYNELGQYYVARQLHAHAWVEALIDADQLPETRAVYGQPPCDHYWLRLDPTPGGAAGGEQDAAGVDQVIDLAQNIWDDYVVEMDSQRQGEAVLKTPVLSPLSQSYSQWINSITSKLAQIRAGELGGGTLAANRAFSLPAAAAGILMTVAVATLLKLRAPNWIRRRISSQTQDQPARPAVDFYASALDQLARLGVVRRSTQTPVEVALQAEQSMSRQQFAPLSEPLQLLTDAYYETRFGSDPGGLASAGGTPSPQRRDAVEGALTELTRRIDQLTSASSHRESVG